MEEEKKTIISTLYKNELRSEEITEVISAIPSWIVRWGITLIILIIGSLLLISSFINYPDVVKTELKIKRSNSLVKLLAQNNTKIIDLKVTDGAQVLKGAVIASTESRRTTSDILKFLEFLKALTNSIEKQKKNSSIQFPSKLRLGDLQEKSEKLYQAYAQFDKTRRDRNLPSRRIILTNEEDEKFEKMDTKNVITSGDFITEEKSYLNAKYSSQQSVLSLVNNNINYSVDEKEFMESDYSIMKPESKFLQALRQIIIETEDWISQNIFIAPLSGKLTYAGVLVEGQDISAGTKVFEITSENEVFFGEITINEHDISKVSIGQEVLIKMRSFPSEQYGIIRGKLNDISESAINDSLFVGKISLDHFENKDSKREIVLRNGMNADAEIITEKSSLLQRIFMNMRKSLIKRG